MMRSIRRAITSTWNLFSNNQLLSGILLFLLTSSGLGIGSLLIFNLRFSLSNWEVQIACQLLTGYPESYERNCFSDTQVLSDYNRDHQAAVEKYENRPFGDYVYIVSSRYEKESCDEGRSECLHFLGRRGSKDFIAAIVPDSRQFDVVQNRERRAPLIAVSSDTIEGSYSTEENYWFIRIVNAYLVSPSQ